MKQPKRLAVLGIIFVNIMWGLSFIGSKRAMAAGLQPFSLVMLRFLTASLILFPLAKIRKTSLHIQWRDVPGLAVSAVSGVTVYFFFELNGLKRMSAATAALIIALIPVFTMLTGMVLHKKRPKPIIWIGAGTSLIGVWMVVQGSTEGDSLMGLLLMIGACVCWVIYGYASDRLLTRLPTLTVTCWQSLFSLVSLIPLCLTEKVNWSEVTLDAWLWACVFLGVICSAVCYIFYNNSIVCLSPETTSLFLNLNPIAAAVGSVFILEEKMTAVQVAGSLLVLISLFVITRQKK